MTHSFLRVLLLHDYYFRGDCIEEVTVVFSFVCEVDSSCCISHAMMTLMLHFVLCIIIDQNASLTCLHRFSFIIHKEKVLLRNKRLTI